MKLAAIAFLASAALAQQQQGPVQRMQDVLPTPPAANIAPQFEMPGIQPNIPVPNVEATEPMQSAVARLASFFDFSHISGENTDTPTVVTHVFDPATGRFTHLSYNVVQNGNAYYVPVCSVDSIVQAGSSAIPASDSCQYGIQLMPVPRNAASVMLRAMRMVLRLLARVPRLLPVILGGQPGASAYTFADQPQM
ncbi:hypothetical protein DL89DRAFT_292850 [Linderina pennispora]|uniref:Uncharacterized protein n=1 Tax=Linderina pennispora TaxID=61395 RepID=A0A1Y1WA42_9FUNG|nr:uncharacterized protein DL89DRAFT_292850 [Linderina pennispora]ORX70188.1 hypothetical protein DL89DRAFT_292850 [Linderina pennispora]